MVEPFKGNDVRGVALATPAFILKSHISLLSLLDVCALSLPNVFEVIKDKVQLKFPRSLFVS